MVLNILSIRDHVNVFIEGFYADLGGHPLVTPRGMAISGSRAFSLMRANHF
jgi:hypothetical protein